MRLFTNLLTKIGLDPRGSERLASAMLPVLPYRTIEESDRHTEERLARRKASRPVRSAASTRGHKTRRAARHDPLMGA